MGKAKDALSDKLFDLLLSFLFSVLALFFKNIKSNSNDFEIFPNTLKLVISRHQIEKITIYISLFFFILALSFLLKFIREKIYIYKHTKQIRPSKLSLSNENNHITSYIKFVYDDKLGYEIKVYRYIENPEYVYKDDELRYIEGNRKEKERVDKLVCKNKECRSYMSSALTYFYNYKYSCSVCDYEFKSNLNESTIKEKMQKKIDSELLNRNR